MDEFAASAMIRCLEHGLKSQGLKMSSIVGTGTARIPLAGKRATVENIVAQFGPMALLRATDGAKAMHEEPLVSVLLAARDPIDLLDRWCRLEKFAHSRHCIHFTGAEQSPTIIYHVNKHGGERPRWYEDTIVFGVLTVLCEMIGNFDIDAGPINDFGEITPWREQGAWKQIDPTQHSDSWGIKASARVQKAEHGLSTPTQQTPSTRLRDLFTKDLLRKWSLRECAEEVVMSQRSLQRLLKCENTSLSQLILETRLSKAMSLMKTPSICLAEIGFLCGFSDQPHFTREFKRYVGLPPDKFRKQLLAS